MEQRCIADAWKTWCSTAAAKDACKTADPPPDLENLTFNARSDEQVLIPGVAVTYWTLNSFRGAPRNPSKDLLGNITVHFTGSVSAMYGSCRKKSLESSRSGELTQTHEVATPDHFRSSHNYSAFYSQSAAAREPLERRLLRTIQIGAPQDVTIAEIQRIAENPNSKYIDNILARSALLVLQQDNPKLIPYNELLDNVLNNLVPDSNAFPTLPALPDFRGKETVFTMVYAMVMSGNQEQVTGVLEKHLLTGGKYKQAVVISALRNIGTPRAVGLIQKYAEAGQESNLAQTAIADEDYPVLFEMHDRWNMIPPAARNRDNLRAIVQSGCDQRAAMAAYWLGFFAPSIDPNKEVADLQALEAIIHKNTPDCEMMEHVIALKSLALRSPKIRCLLEPARAPDLQRVGAPPDRHQCLGPLRPQIRARGSRSSQDRTLAIHSVGASKR